MATYPTLSATLDIIKKIYPSSYLSLGHVFEKMDYSSRQHGPEASALPSILIATDPPPRLGHMPHSNPSYSSSTSAMSIPGVREMEEVPPALPPPPFPFGKPPNSDYREPRHGSFASFSSREPSLFGSFSNSMGDHHHHHHHRDGPIVRVDRDEGYASLSSTRYGTTLIHGPGERPDHAGDILCQCHPCAGH